MGASVLSQASRHPDNGGSDAPHLGSRDISDAIFAPPDLGTFCGPSGLGRTATGQRIEPQVRQDTCKITAHGNGRRGRCPLGSNERRHRPDVDRTGHCFVPPLSVTQFMSSHLGPLRPPPAPTSRRGTPPAVAARIQAIFPTGSAESTGQEISTVKL